MMLGVSSRTRSRNATAYQSLDDKGKRVFKNRKKAKLDVIDVEKGNNSDEVEGSGTNIDKGDTFNINNAPGSVAEKPIVIIIDSDSNSESDDDGDVNGSDDDCDDGVANGGDVNGSDDDDDDGLYSSSDGLYSSSDERGTSDEDFEGSESSSSEESFSSYDDEKEEEQEDDDDDDDDDDVVVVRKVKNEINGMRRCTKDEENFSSDVDEKEEEQDDDDDDDDVVVVRKVKKERCTRDGVSESNFENVDDADSENSPLFVVDDVVVVKKVKNERCTRDGVNESNFENVDDADSENSPLFVVDDVVVRKVKKERCTRDGVIERNYENVDDGNSENSPFFVVDDDECGVEDQEELKDEEELWEEMEEQIDSLIGNIGTNDATPEKKGYYENISCVEKEGCFDSSKGGQKKAVKNSPLSVDDDECGVEDHEKLQHSEYATPSMSSSSLLENTAYSENGGSIDSSKLYDEEEKKSKNVEELWKEMDILLQEIDSPIVNICTNEATPEKKDYYEKKGVKRRKNEVESDDDVQVIEKKTRIEKWDCLDSSELFKGSEKNGVKRVITEVESDDDVQVIEVKAQKNKKKKEYSLRSRQNVEPVLEELGDSTKVQNSQTKNANASEKVDSHVRKLNNVRGNARTDRKYDGDPNVKSVGQFKPKELRLMEKLFAEWGEENSKKKDSIGLKEKDSGDVHKVDTPAPACGETLPSIWSLEEKSEPLGKSEDEKELDELWEEAEIYINEAKVYPLIGKIGANEATPTSLCEHHFYLDEEIGEYCNRCGFVKTEIKNISPPVVDRFPYEGSGNRMSDSEVKGPLIDESLLDDRDGDPAAVLCHKEGTVWDLIPDVKQSLYPHQQEGFEFIWKNLAGNIDLNKLESPDRCSEGGCIICHYPGTGKTRLTIMFLKSYLEVYPKCRPVIVAPASLMLTWEREFKKWDIGVPFHNLKNPELSGNELCEDVDSVDWSPRDMKFRRMVKLRSWYREKSILGISYGLYAHLAGSKPMEKNERCMKADPKMKEINEFDLMGRFLREVPGLLVLDEGHKPRNHRSGIWQVLTQVKANKRIILSGTPFQNNFRELYNTLTLVKPSLPKTFPQELENFCQNRKMQEKKSPEGWSWEPISSGNVTGNLVDDKISQLKSRMESIVHVYQGGILKNKLPGLKECVLTLKPNSFQKEILDSIESSQKKFRFERKLALASVHPSLFLHCTALTKKEKSVLDKELLEKQRLKPYGGVKTKFLVKFVWLCDSFNEKVLVFSQFIDPLVLIKEQLESELKWSEGKEVLYMSGKVDAKTKQSRIDTFNDPKSEAKIMLASTKACNEGISLVGASRVVLLDVVWNPSVERQAISRAYRLGQEKIVYTYHLITEGTAEWTKYGKQAEKERLSELVFSDKAAAENDVQNRSVNFEDRVLDLMIRHEELKNMFGEHVVDPNERDLFSSFGVYDS